MARQEKKLVRVNKNNRCPICGHDSWCLVGEQSILCMRQASNRQITLSSGEIGWWHRQLGQATIEIQKKAPAPVINSGKLMEEFSAATWPDMQRSFAERLGVTMQSLVALGAAWAVGHSAWAFPMRDGYGEMTGIRLRAESGAKWAIAGSHAGIFLPSCEPSATTLVCEGPTDTAAALSLGYFAIGRPSCSGGTPHIVTAVKRLKIKRAAIIADNDSPGLFGADTLAKHLPVPSCIAVLPAKDLREFSKLGGTKELLDSQINSLTWRQPK